MKTFWAWLILLLPLCANALGVRDIEAFSALNQPLNAKIGLVSTRGLDVRDIKVRLASPKVFNEAEIGRPYFLTRLKFEPKVAADGNIYIQISSKNIVREPYLDFMLEISWRGGSLIKEFAVLLDPVIIQRASPQPTSEAPKLATGETPPAKKQVYGPVKRAETLWVIAQKTRPSKSIPITQMIMAIHQENPDAFVRGNINLLKQGATLTIPDQRKIIGLTSGTATKLYSEQDQAWKGQQSTTIKPEPPQPQTADMEPEIIQEENPKREIEPNTDTPPATTATTATDATEITDDGPAQLQIVATPESQLNEIAQSQEDKTFPKGKIEQLRESIADKAEDVTALESINQDLIKLRSALKSKIALVREELDKTNQAIAIVSGKLEDGDVVTDAATSTEDKTDTGTDTVPTIPVEQDTPKSDPEQITVKSNPEIAAEVTEEPATSVATVIDSPEPEPPSGINITTDRAESERINRLETEIESLKSQSQVFQMQKYLIIILALAFLVALALLIGTNRKNRPAEKKHPQTPILDRPKQFAPLAGIEQEAKVQSGEIKQAHLNRHLEMPFDKSHTGSEEEISFAERPATLSNHDSVLSPVASVAPTLDESPTPNAILFESSHTEAGRDIDSIITTVDVYLAYRRLTEAESILHNAIEKHPDSAELKAKLLEIYAFKKDANQFAQYLEKYKEELSAQMPERWAEILVAGIQLMPDHPYMEAYTKEIQAGNPGTKDIEAGPAILVDELIVSDVDMPDDDLFSVDKDDSDPFDIDLDLDDLKKS